MARQNAIRRIAIALLPAVLAGASAGCQGEVPAAAATQPGPATAAETPAAYEVFGARPDPKRGPIGGGEGYPDVRETGEFVVHDADELLEALGQAEPGQVVYVADEARIDLTGRQKIVIPAGVTLAGGRGRPGIVGALLFTTDIGEHEPEERSRPLLLTGGPGVRVTGLRIEGPDPLRRTDQMWDLYNCGGDALYYTLPNSEGIHIRHPKAVVDNCELSGWTWSAVRIEEGAERAHIHHNSIHHCQRQGLGYGVMISQADALIESNRFDWCRHAIAGTGREGTSYEARDNIIGPNANSHAFDMHGGHDRKDGTTLAGERVRIHHNTFHLKDHPAIVIRGLPAEPAEIHHNRFAHASIGDAVVQKNAKGNMRIGPNMISPPGRIEEPKD